jgi:hypothetical protein
MNTIHRTALLLSLTACGAEESIPLPPPVGPISVQFDQPHDHARVTSPFPARLSAQNVRIARRGTDGERVGYFALAIDRPCAAPGESVALDAGYLHLDEGQHEYELRLAPGDHDLCALILDRERRAYDAHHSIIVYVEF